MVPAGLARANDQPKPAERRRYIIGAWMNTGQPAKSDMEILRLLHLELGKVLIADVTYKWAEAWVKSMKLDAAKNYAPSTIRKRIGSLSRCFDWWLRQSQDVNLGNPLKLLPRGLASYNGKDSEEIAQANAAASPGEQALAVRMADLIPGQVNLVFDNIPSSVGLIQAGQIRPLAVAAKQRLKNFPQIPTYAEVGLPAMNNPSWFGLGALAGTPPKILDQLNAAVRQALADPAVIVAIEKQSAIPSAMSRRLRHTRRQ